MTEYVLGFMYHKRFLTPRRDDDLVLEYQVALIKKSKPEWQKGKYNGIGGRVEEGEQPIDAMVREFKEETAMDTLQKDWRYFLTLGKLGVGGAREKDWVVFCYSAFTDIVPSLVNSKKDETPIWVSINEAMYWNSDKMIRNLTWLIPMGLDHTIQYNIENQWLIRTAVDHAVNSGLIPERGSTQDRT